MRQGYKDLWDTKIQKHMLHMEIVRRTPTYQRRFDEAFTKYLQSAYGNDADIIALKADPKVRAIFVDESLEGKELASSMGLSALMDADLSKKIPTIAHYKSTVRLIRANAEDKPSSSLDEPGPGKPPNPIMDTLRDGRYLTLEIDLQNPQEDIRAALDFLVFAVFWEGVNQGRQKTPRTKALNADDIKFFDLKADGEKVLRIMRENYPNTRGKDPNVDPKAKSRYRSLLSRIKTVKELMHDWGDWGLVLGWKNIAALFGISIRTAQNWEENRGLPVLRWRRGRGGRPRVYIEKGIVRAWLVKDMNEQRKLRINKGVQSAK